MAMLVFALAANASVQLWGASASWSRATEQRQDTLRRIDADLLRREYALRQAALAWQAEAPGCEVAAQRLRQQLEADGAPLPAGVSRQVSTEAAAGANAFWLVYRAEPLGLERRRLFSASAHGLCPPPEAESAPLTDSEVGA
ncbi:hypothetical protein KBY66_03125 [Synechococcus sp. Tobar12-5m-g]|uniref:hypothetical protein n=1 Tax=unclassified Synechococcus TaxID=2626047 RepID=UPI0020CC211F|nr:MULTISPECIES: hypothetical protein [unclassified Synechococcus]MCP9771624.1 hypothetical protein [Synechococcus sp. Tobar12-5m-g]MCP9872565.1 hypothetical protein [Synechococcus sp. Cruz CV-v-12]